MNPATFRFLLTPEGQALLAETAAIPITPEQHLPLATQLRRRVTPEQARAILETALLRQRAAAKFTRAERMYFLRPALEQASAEIISRYRAGRFAAAGLRLVADLGCGIGGDALALAAHGRVIGVELDGLRLLMARQNVAVYGRAAAFRPVQADLRQLAPWPVDAFFADPARRDEQGRRIFAVDHYRPPLALFELWRQHSAAGAVKISPAVDYDDLPADAEIEFISVNGEVREGVLWYGDLHSGVERRATLLPAEVSLSNAGATPAIAVTAPRRYLYEPDGAVIRAHLVEQLARQLGADKIDEDIAYLTADQPRATPFARCFAVEAVFPFQLKRLRHYLRQQRVGQVTIKKRGSPLAPEMLRRQLRLRGPEQRLIFLTHVKGEAAVIIGQEI